MTSAQVVTAAVAAYAAIVSTLSLILAVKVHRAANPSVSLDWLYSEADRKLTLSVLNTGRGDVTVSAVDLYIIREVIIRGSREAGQWDSRIEMISHIEPKSWLRKSKGLTLPYRLVANSMFSVRVNNDAIILPSEYPLNELQLQFVARFPGGESVAYLVGDTLAHFVGIIPELPPIPRVRRIPFLK